MDIKVSSMSIHSSQPTELAGLVASWWNFYLYHLQPIVTLANHNVIIGQSRGRTMTTVTAVKE